MVKASQYVDFFLLLLFCYFYFCLLLAISLAPKWHQNSRSRVFAVALTKATFPVISLMIQNVSSGTSLSGSSLCGNSPQWRKGYCTNLGKLNNNVTTSAFYFPFRTCCNCTQCFFFPKWSCTISVGGLKGACDNEFSSKSFCVPIFVYDRALWCELSLSPTLAFLALAISRT